MMSHLNDLVGRLAYEAGFSRDLRTVHNGDQPRSAAQLGALLGAIGLPSDTEHACRESLAKLRARKYGTGGVKFPGTVTCRENHPANIQFVCPDDLRSRNFRWHATPIRPRHSTAPRGEFSVSSAREVWRFDFLPNHALVECQLPFGSELPIGIYDLDIVAPGADAPQRIRLFKAPLRCPRPKRRSWGYTMQLPTAVSASNCGRGNFMDMVPVAEQIAKFGGSYLGVTPIYLGDSHPYFTQSLLATDWTQSCPLGIAKHLGNAKVTAWLTAGEGRARIETLRRAPHIDSEGVRALMRDVMAMLWGDFDQSNAPEFQRYLAARPYLTALGVYLHHRETMLASRPDGWDFRTWGILAHPNSVAISRVAQLRPQQVEFHTFAQWLAHTQLSGVAERCRTLGVRLYLDIPLSPGPGFDEWMWQSVFLSRLETGAPGDAFQRNGQTWGSLPKWVVGLRESGYDPIVLAFDLIMGIAGIARLDHFMSVQRYFSILRGSHPNDGAYLYTAMEEMLDIIVLLSHLHDCPIVGEDLGNVDPRVRHAMYERGILRMPIMIFEHDEQDEFHDAHRYPELGVTSWGSHDLPAPLRWVSGADISLAQQLGHLSGDQAGQEWHRRRKLIHSLSRKIGGPVNAGDIAVVNGIYRFLGHSPADVVMVHGEDPCPQASQPNVPGTRTGRGPGEYPNYGERFPTPVEQIAEEAASLFALMHEIRP